MKKGPLFLHNAGYIDITTDRGCSATGTQLLAGLGLLSVATWLGNAGKNRIGLIAAYSAPFTYNTVPVHSIVRNIFRSYLRQVGRDFPAAQFLRHETPGFCRQDDRRTVGG